MLRVLSAGSTLHGLRACASLAAQAVGGKVAIATDHGHTIRDEVLSGTAQADVVLLPADMIDALAAIRCGVSLLYVALRQLPLPSGVTSVVTR